LFFNQQSKKNISKCLKEILKNKAQECKTKNYARGKNLLLSNLNNLKLNSKEKSRDAAVAEESSKNS